VEGYSDPYHQNRPSEISSIDLRATTIQEKRNPRTCPPQQFLPPGPHHESRLYPVVGAYAHLGKERGSSRDRFNVWTTRPRRINNAASLRMFAILPTSPKIANRSTCGRPFTCLVISRIRGLTSPWIPPQSSTNCWWHRERRVMACAPPRRHAVRASPSKKTLFRSHSLGLPPKSIDHRPE